jgi:hypothetical protein
MALQVSVDAKPNVLAACVLILVQKAPFLFTSFDRGTDIRKVPAACTKVRGMVVCFNFLANQSRQHNPMI